MNIRTCRRCRTSSSARCRARAITSFFFVGDVKQSIYRFRLADPTIFLDKYARFADFRAVAPGAPRRILLRENFPPAARCWKGPTTSFPTSCPARSASWTMTTRPACAPERATRTTAKSRSLPCSSCRTRTTTRPRRKKAALEADYVARRIRALIDGGTPCGKTAPSAPRTMATRSSCCAMPTASALYRAALEAHGIPCRRRRAAGSTRPREVSVLRSLLAVVDNPHQDVPLHRGAALAAVRPDGGRSGRRAHVRPRSRFFYTGRSRSPPRRATTAGTFSTCSRATARCRSSCR